jgi:hypothetical protein
MSANECHPSAGLTLIEMLLALTFSIILLGNVSGLYVIMKKNYRLQVGLSYVQQNRRLFAGILRREIHENGYQGVKHYFIDATRRKNEKGGTVFALYRTDRNHTKTEVIENIQAMQVRYDVIENDRLVEKNMEAINDWRNVRGVSISYLLRDPSELIKKTGYFYAAIVQKTKQ